MCNKLLTWLINLYMVDDAVHLWSIVTSNWKTFHVGQLLVTSFSCLKSNQGGSCWVFAIDGDTDDRTIIADISQVRFRAVDLLECGSPVLSATNRHRFLWAELWDEDTPQDCLADLDPSPARFDHAWVWGGRSWSCGSWRFSRSGACWTVQSPILTESRLWVLAGEYGANHSSLQYLWEQGVFAESFSDQTVRHSQLIIRPCTYE